MIKPRTFNFSVESFCLNTLLSLLPQFAQEVGRTNVPFQMHEILHIFIITFLDHLYFAHVMQQIFNELSSYIFCNAFF